MANEAQDIDPLLWDTLRPEDIVIITAFGATDEDKRRLVRKGIAVFHYDATCMLVEKVWKAARAYGRDLAFFYGWGRATVINGGSLALLGFVFGDYASRLASFGPHSAAIWAAAVIVALTLVNLASLVLSARAQTWLTVAEVGGLLLRRARTQPGGDVSAVEMRHYISDLGEALAQALTLQGGVTLSSEADEATMDRDRAVTIGLLINELVTNAAKHAFTGRDRGAVEIKFRRTDSGWRLVVADDGIGIDHAKAERAKGGLGQRLVDAFARQANGTLNIDSDAAGTRVTVDFKA